MKIKLISLVIATTISSPSFSANEYWYTDDQKIKLSEKNIQAHLTERVGKPVLHIEKPDSNGVSHNFFDEFSVGKEGLFINNKNKADVIINEVISDSQSVLSGNIRVVFNNADLIIANPNSITCDGCSTTNAPNTTLITGKITDSVNKKDPLSYQSSDSKIEIINTSNINNNYKKNAEKNKLSLIANQIIIKNSTIDIPDVFIKTTETNEYISHKTGTYYHSHTPGILTEETVEERRPSLLYIDESSSILSDKLKIDAHSGHVVNNGSIKSYKNDTNLSHVLFVNSGNITSVISDVTSFYSSMYNRGNITAQKLNMSFNDTHHHFDTSEKEYIPAKFAFVNDGIIKGSFAKIDSRGADLKNNGNIDMWGRTNIALHNEYDMVEHKLINNGTISNQY
ncbi:filamentous hemagglutinin N-terminal domain-containing protein [Morganella morganii]|uniref:filamentous hemagglutinin N-terminal domain-containing protein n=1 Tax=Morganella morganii TaxID=582 RepID=UPI001BDA9B11|nr:filamentous hemagglutinin N-terminal domain-containing protein [Morganella morganii]MBT0309860.1 filamentous hemagglutinin N-terminal domain-containing protein [Morganella morganii subsp. morganii]